MLQGYIAPARTRKGGEGNVLLRGTDYGNNRNKRVVDLCVFRRRVGSIRRGYRCRLRLIVIVAASI